MRLGVIGRYIKSVKEFIQILIKIMNTNVMIQSTANSLQRNVEKLKTKLNEQTSQAHQIVTAAEEMNQTITDIARNATQASDLATKYQKVAHG